MPDFGPKTQSLQSSKIGTCVSRFQCVCVLLSVFLCLSLSFSVFLCLSLSSLSFSVFLCLLGLCFTGRVHCKPKNPIDPRLCFFVLPPLRAWSTRCDSLFSSLHVRDFGNIGVTWKGRRWRFAGRRHTPYKRICGS